MGNRGLAPPWGSGMAGHPVSGGQRTSTVVTEGLCDCVRVLVSVCVTWRHMCGGSVGLWL